MSNQIFNPEKATHLRPATASSQADTQPKAKSETATPEPVKSVDPTVPTSPPEQVLEPAPTNPAPQRPTEQPKPEDELSLKNIKQIFRLLLSEDIEKLQDTVQELADAMGEHEGTLGGHEEDLEEHGRKLELLASNIKTHVVTLRNETKAGDDALEQKIKSFEEKTTISITAINETLEHLRKNFDTAINETLEHLRKNFDSFVTHLQSFTLESGQANKQPANKETVPQSPEVAKH